MLALSVSAPGAGKLLTPEALAADFGPKTAHMRECVAALDRAGAANPLSSYYSLLLECVAARARGVSLPREAAQREIQEPLLHRLSQYVLPEHATDLLSDVYRQLFPRAVRHKLGEYYTPGWLAERVLAETLGADLGNANKRVLDPACGSGAFLVLAIRHIRRRVALGEISRPEALRQILRNVIGFDVNPLAVQAARANYLVALGDLVSLDRERIRVPVFQADSVLGAPEIGEFEGDCDFIVGNPPWVNWESLAEEYRRKTRPLWEHYGLFPKRRTALESILGGSKYDLSMLMTYVAADRYLRRGGRLGFVVSQALLKTGAAGEGFRRLRLPDGTPLGVRAVEDLVRLKPFDSATNRTATLVLEKGRETEFPVEYRVHSSAGVSCWVGQPIAAGDPSSVWVAARAGAIAAVLRILGPSPYRAREGANTGGANGVFWIEVMDRPGRHAAIRNVTEGARKPVPRTKAKVEAGLVYPLLRGQNVSRWSARPEQSILMTHRPGMRLRAIPEPEMKRAFPCSFAYLKRFEELLRTRPAYRRYFRSDAPFYSLFNIGDYTFAPWKVVWREQAFPFTAAVADSAVVPDHKLMIVPVRSRREAHYVCGVLNSLPVSAAVAAYAIETQLNTHVLEHIGVPQFDSRNPIHRGISSASQRAHEAVARGNGGVLNRAEERVNRHVAQIWGLSDSDLDEMREFLKEAGSA